VSLPEHVESPEPPIEYAVRDLEGGAIVRIAVELADGRFTIATNEPHVKVAWRIRGRKPPNE
jgi:hypothetical protein